MYDGIDNYGAGEPDTSISDNNVVNVNGQKQTTIGEQPKKKMKGVEFLWAGLGFFVGAAIMLSIGLVLNKIKEVERYSLHDNYVEDQVDDATTDFLLKDILESDTVLSEKKISELVSKEISAEVKSQPLENLFVKEKYFSLNLIDIINAYETNNELCVLLSVKVSDTSGTGLKYFEFIFEKKDEEYVLNSVGNIAEY